MLRGLQTHFDAGLHDTLTMHTLQTKQVRMGRADVQYISADEINAVMSQLIGSNIVPLAIVSTPEQIEALPSGSYAEYLNEPDGDIPAADYRAGLLACYAVAKKYNVTLCGPAISNLIPDRIEFAGECLADTPLDIIATFHRYSPDESKPYYVSHKPYISRPAEIAAFRQAVGPRRIANSEFGYSTGKYRPFWWAWWTTRQTNAAQAAKIRQEFQLYEREQLEFAILYQLNDGLTDKPIDQFGIRDEHGEWKEQSNTFID